MLQGDARTAEAALLTVIICNYNYGRFVGEAITSALNIDWPRLQVIVIDDGSTDNSREVIESFLPRGVRALFCENRGQAKATSNAYQHSAGDWILFLDADDIVCPSIAKKGAAAMKTGWSMIQFQMTTINEQGESLNSVFPKYIRNVTPGLIRKWVTTTDSYPTPPNSGNLLNRNFLNKIFPLEEDMDRAPDSYFLSTAPFLGDVLTVNEPMVFHRLHRSNVGAQFSLNISKLQTDLVRHIRRCEYATRVAKEHGLSIPHDRWRFGFYNLAMRIASVKIASTTHPLRDDTIPKCLTDWARSTLKPQGLPALRHIGMSGWLLCISLLPKSWAEQLISWRFAPPSRPSFLRALLRIT